MVISEFKRNPQENEIQTLWRIGKLKDDEVLEASWVEIADFMNKEFRADETEFRTEAAYRKQYKNGRLFFEQVFSGMGATSSLLDSQDCTDLKDQLREIEKARIQLRDERTAYKSDLRAEARLDQSLNYLADELRALGEAQFPPMESYAQPPSPDELVVLLSDWHLGLEFSNPFGAYNLHIACNRIEKLANAVLGAQKKYGVSKCVVAVLGDMISGNCHPQIAIQNRENVIEQIKTACEYVSEFVQLVSKGFEQTRVISVCGNHSRIAPKRDAVKDERLDDLIPWYLENVFSHRNDVKVCSSMDSSIGLLNICGKSYCFVHGDNDDISHAAVSKISSMIGEIPYAICRGHKHCTSYYEVDRVQIVQGGSLVGMGDDYTIEKRLSGTPSQTILLCSNRGVEMYMPTIVE